MTCAVLDTTEHEGPAAEWSAPICISLLDMPLGFPNMRLHPHTDKILQHESRQVSSLSISTSGLHFFFPDALSGLCTYYLHVAIPYAFPATPDPNQIAIVHPKYRPALSPSIPWSLPPVSCRILLFLAVQLSNTYSPVPSPVLCRAP